MRRLILFFVLVFLASGMFAQQKEVSYTLADSDRSVRVVAELKSMRHEMDTKIDVLRAEMNIKFDASNQRISDQQTLLYWGFGILFSMMLFLPGYNIWDRRTLMTPMKESQDKIIEMLKEAGEDNPDILRAFKKASLW